IRAGPAPLLFQQRSSRETKNNSTTSFHIPYRASNSSQNGGTADTSDPNDVRGSAQGHVLFLGQVPDPFEAVDHHPFEFFTDTGQVPVEVLAILDPLKVAYRDTAGIGQNVGDYD